MGAGHKLRTQAGKKPVSKPFSHDIAKYTRAASIIASRYAKRENEGLASEDQQKRRYKQEGAEWTLQGKFWLFGTATYKRGDLVSDAKLKRDARKFFNALDRKALPRVLVENDLRLP